MSSVQATPVRAWLAALDMPVTVHPCNRFAHDVLRGSPGDVWWDGSILHTVRRCPEAWLVHEIAHRIEALVDRPEDADRVNYGFPRPVFGSEIIPAATWREREMTAASLTILLLAAAGRPWRAAAARLGDSDAMTEDEDRDRVQTGILHGAMTASLPYADFVYKRLRLDIVAIFAATNQRDDWILLSASDIA